MAMSRIAKGGYFIYEKENGFGISYSGNDFNNACRMRKQFSTVICGGNICWDGRKKYSGSCVIYSIVIQRCEGKTDSCLQRS